MELLLALVVGVLIGAAIGWFAHGRPEDPSLAPLHQAVAQLGQQVGALEKDRAAAFSSLTSQVQSMTRTSALLSDRTQRLASALQSPNVRGRWGEMQLERVAELSGMNRHCDFDTQVTRTSRGRSVRPDMVVYLSGGRQLVVDAKAPFVAYLDALETDDPEEHQALLRRHANHLRSHIQQLATKDYQEAFYPTPEFVVMFIPADTFLDAALAADPTLLDYAFEHNVVIATPATLVALLRTVGLGWQQQAVSDQAAKVQQLGRELYQRLGTMSEHYNRVGQSLQRAVESYNATLASMDARVMVTARKLHEMNLPGTSAEPTELEPNTSQTRWHE